VNKKYKNKTCAYHTASLVGAITIMGSMSVCYSHTISLFAASGHFISVGALIKVGEQEQKHNTVQTNPDHKSFWIITVSP
jgi:hypothetical protein